MFTLSVFIIVCSINLATTVASPVIDVHERSACTAEERLAGARLIVESYNRVLPGESVQGFNQLPLADDCHVYINPNGGPPIPFAIDEATTKDFAIATRQLFTQVTGTYTDLPDNQTSIIHTNVTLGVLHAIEVPVTFYADVFLFYEAESCLMRVIQAFAQFPTRVAGIEISPPILSMLSNASALYPKPIVPS